MNRSVSAPGRSSRDSLEARSSTDMITGHKRHVTHVVSSQQLSQEFESRRDRRNPNRVSFFGFN